LASGTEILYALGLGSRVVAVSHECDYPPDAARKPRVTRSFIAARTSGQIDAQVRVLLADGQPLYEVDSAALAALAPDLIVTQAQCDVCAVKYEDVLALVEAEPALAETRVVALNPMTLDGIFADILLIAEATGRRASGEHYVAELRRRVAAVSAKTVALAPDERPRVAAIEWIDPLMLAAHWMPGLIELAGARQPLITGGQHSAYNRWEEVVAYDPHVILVMPCGFDLARAAAEADLLRALPGWETLRAVHDARVFAVDGNAYFNRSGPRIVDSLEILAGLAHPELFGLPATFSDGIPVWQRL